MASDSVEAPYELVKTMRASILVLGLLLARFGERARVAGGCAIGQRPVDQRNCWPAGDGRADLDRARLRGVVKASRLTGARIVTDMVTVTGTENPTRWPPRWPTARR
ncbi:MAG: hypothetical protein R3E41_09420 [Burkholderiaceae bacterium]